MRLKSKYSNFVIDPLTSQSEILEYLNKGWWMYGKDKKAYLWYILGQRAQLIRMRKDKNPSIGAHVTGWKIVFDKNREMFVKRIIITNFIAEEVELGYVNLSGGDNRHGIYVEG